MAHKCIYVVLEGRSNRRRIKTEEIVAVVWGTELIQFITTPAIFLQDDLKKGMN